MDEAIRKHLIDKIAQAPIKTEPYPHFYIEEVFPESFYQEIMANIPEVSSYTNLSQSGIVAKGTYQERFILPLDQEHLSNLHFTQCLFWNELSLVLKSTPWISMLIEKFQSSIKERFHVYYERVNFTSEIELFKDLSNYSIGPHTDHPVRVITLLFYFPNTKTQSHLGTSIYRPLDNTFSCEGFKHHPVDQFAKVYTAPFLPNSAFGFLKSDFSFHGVEQIKEQHIERNLMNYYLKWTHK